MGEWVGGWMVAQQQQTPKDTRIDDGLGFFFLYVIALYCIRRLTKTKCSSNGPRRRREGLPHLHPQHHAEISQGSFFFHDCESSEAERERLAIRFLRADYTNARIPEALQIDSTGSSKQHIIHCKKKNKTLKTELKT